MTIPRMSAEKIERLFKGGIVAAGPKRNRESPKPSREPLLTPEQDVALGELIREQSRKPFPTTEDSAKLGTMMREQARSPSKERSTKSQSLYETIISSLTRGKGNG